MFSTVSSLIKEMYMGAPNSHNYKQSTHKIIRLEKDIDDTGKRQEQDRDDSTQQIRLLRVTIAFDNLAWHQGRSLSSQPPSEISLTFCIVDLVFCLLTVYNCDCWERPYTFL